jgi:glutamate--cysteine ligase
MEPVSTTLWPSLARPAAIAIPPAVASRLRAFLEADGARPLLSGAWGLEREGLRIEPDGQPARTPHPFPPEDATLTVDFAECQAEIITEPHASLESARAALASAQRRLERAMGNELLWPLSLPGRWDEPERLVAASFAGRPEWTAARAYRQALLRRHGRARQAISGLHYNFSFGHSFFTAWRAAVASSASERDLRDDAYFALMRNFLRHQHVFNALWGMSPPEDDAFWRDLLRASPPAVRAQARRCRSRTSSVRLSPLGYGLAPDLARAIGVTFASLTEYRERLGAALKAGPDQPALLANEREFYSPVRPKVTPSREAAPAKDSPGTMLDQLGRDGAGYLEFRVFDLDPFDPVGVSLEALRFFHVFILANLFQPSPLLGEEERSSLAQRWRWSTLCGTPLCDCVGAPGDEASVENLFATMSGIAAHLPAAYADAVAGASARWRGAPTRLIDRWRDERSREPGGALALGLRLAREHRDTLLSSAS